MEKIVLLEKDLTLKSLLKIFIEESGREFMAQFANLNKSYTFLQEQEFDLLLVDMNIFDNPFLEQEYKEKLSNLNIPILIFGSDEEMPLAQKIGNPSILGFLKKPLTRELLNFNITLAINKQVAIQKQSTDKYLSETTCSCVCQSDGLILSSGDLFKEYFLNEIKDERPLYLNDIFKYSPFFNEFKKNSSELKSTKSKNLYLSFLGIPYKAHIEYHSEENIKLSFKKQKLTEKQFVQSHMENKFNQLFQYSTESLLLFNPNNQLVKINKIALRNVLTKFKKNIFPGLTLDRIFNFFSPRDTKEILNALGTKTIFSKSRIINISGKQRYYIFKLIPIPSEIETNTPNWYIISLKDITEEEEQRIKIKDLEQKAKTIYESTIQRFYLLDSKKNIIEYNQAAYQQILQERNIILTIGKNILDLMPEQKDKDLFSENFEKTLQGKHIKIKLKSIIKGKTYWSEVHFDPVINEHNVLDRVFIWTIDITEIEEKLNVVQTQNTRYKALLSKESSGVWDWDIVNNSCHFSKLYLSLIGYDDFPINQKINFRNKLIHPQEVEKNQTLLKRILNGEIDSFKEEFRLQSRNSLYKYLLEKGQVIKDNSGNPIRVLTSVHDITEQKIKEETLKQSRFDIAKIKILLQNTKFCLLKSDFNNKSKIYFVTENVKDITGYSSQSIINKGINFDQLIYQEDKKKINTQTQKAIDKKIYVVDYDEYRLVKEDGRIIWIKETRLFIPNKKGAIENILHLFYDVSNERHINNNYTELHQTFSLLWNNLKTITFISDLNQNILSCNHPDLDNKDLNSLLKEVYIQENNLNEKIKEQSFDYDLFSITFEQQINLRFIQIDEERMMIITNIAK